MYILFRAVKYIKISLCVKKALSSAIRTCRTKHSRNVNVFLLHFNCLSYLSLIFIYCKDMKQYFVSGNFLVKGSDTFWYFQILCRAMISEQYCLFCFTSLRFHPSLTLVFFMQAILVLSWNIFLPDVYEKWMTMQHSPE